VSNSVVIKRASANSVGFIEIEQASEGRQAGSGGVFPADGGGELQKAGYDGRLVFDIQRGNEAGGDGGQIGQALVLFEAADVGVAVANGDGQFALGEAGPAAEVFQQIAGAVAIALLIVAVFTARMWAATAETASLAERARAADAARWAGLAESYANVIPVTGAGSEFQRSAQADAARWQGMAEAYAYDSQRAWDASSARYTALAESYGAVIAVTGAEYDAQRAWEAAAARWAGLALHYQNKANK